MGAPPPILTTPGIGQALALALLYEIDDIGRFPTVQQFSSYCHLVKGTVASGAKIKRLRGAKLGNLYNFLCAGPRRLVICQPLTQDLGRAARSTRPVFFMTMENRCYTFVAGDAGPWRITAVQTVIGQPLEPAPALAVQNASLPALPTGARWLLRGVTSNQRYVTRPEQTSLVAVQAGLGRPEATCAALIPITKTPAWWALTQDERREIFESRSAHIATGLRFLPAIARRLHHCRDLGEPFDFLTWFEFAPSDTAAFDDLVAALRATEEWKYVEREVDIRLVRQDA